MTPWNAAATENEIAMICILKGEIAISRSESSVGMALD
jgi:hypothetical protein